MRSKTKNTITAGLYFLFIIWLSCNSQKKGTDKKTSAKLNKRDYELANEFLDTLKNEKADTIIFYQRTCINCCDFFNIFWSANGQRRLSKFYFDFEDMQTHSKIVTVKSDKIFEVLKENYDELKATSIIAGSTASLVDHYCYTQMSIYVNQDSIITDRMIDPEFVVHINNSANKDKKSRKIVTDDINSKWNLYLKVIENELAIMPETIAREKETLKNRERK